MMYDSDDTDRRLLAFLRRSRFTEIGAVISDLDGTAVHEHDGRIYIPPAMASGLGSVHAAGRQVVINSLRFPLSVINVFGDDWYGATRCPVPLVSLKGSQVGLLSPDRTGRLHFDELDAQVLSPEEVEEVMRGVEGVVNEGANLLVFFYPRDWRQGELLWTPRADHVEPLKQKYLSASSVITGDVPMLRDTLLSQPLCMIFLLIERAGDDRMAYQHTHQSSFFTHGGVDKLHGAQVIARHLGLDLAHCIGAGDAEPDNFLKATGLSIIVGNAELDHKGLHETLRVPDAGEFGRLLSVLSAAQGTP
jgi:hydroxymethylpyrimidine pyrophosphatase-like HAD family hydrolase